MKMSSGHVTRRVAMPLLVAGLGMLAGIGPTTVVHAEEQEADRKDAFVCMEETQEQCDFNNTNMALFIQARDAYDRGRETGDLGEARRIALELVQRGDVQHGNSLLRFIYLQIGQGAHKNYVEAYRWVVADAAAGIEIKRLDLARIRDQLAKRMTPEQLAEATK